MYPYLQRQLALGSSMFICPAYQPREACQPRVWHVLSAQTPLLQRPVTLGYGMLICLPGEVCGAGVWHVYSLCLPPYRGLSRQGLACLVDMHTYLESPVGLRFDMFICPSSLHIEACPASLWHVYSPCVHTYGSLTRWGFGKVHLCFLFT